MIIIKKVLAAALKNIGTTLYMIGARLASGLLKEYNTAKANYFYGKAEENVEEWLTKIDQIIEANNMADG